MKPADDPAIDYVELVRRGYDACAASYDAARRPAPEPILSRLIERLPPDAAVLDIGCGGGVPVAKRLAQTFRVTGVDLSPKMIDLARRNVPNATLLCGDIMKAEFAPNSFAAVVSFYAIFHLDRERHPALFRRIYGWLAPGGYLLATLSRHDEPSYTEDDFFGVTMHWSSYSLSRYESLLQEIGFEIVQVTETGHGYDAEHDTPAERHPLVLARKPAPA